LLITISPDRKSMRWYALAQRPWVEEAGFGFWGLPPGTIGSVDLAPVGAQSHVFVTSDKPFDPADVAAAIGDGTRLDSYVPTAAEATAWATLIGVTIQPSWTLLDLLWATLTAEADPDGVTRAKPIMPTHKGVLELHLGGHSLLRAEKLPDDPTTHPAWPNIQRVLQNDYRAIQGRDRTLARKWLGAQQAKYRLTHESARDLLIPAGLPRVLPLKPTTTITDDFNRADADALGASSEGWSWTEVLGDIDIVSNAASSVGVIQDNFARAEVDLSSDDHKSKIAVVVAGNRNREVYARFAAAAVTFYRAIHRNESTNTIRLFKQVAGTLTQIGTSINETPAATPTLEIECDGSTIIFRVNSVDRITETDTSITGNLRTGFGNSGTQQQVSLDNFEAADLLAGGLDLVRAVGEALGLTGARARAMALARDRVETQGIAETGVVARALARLRAEAVGLTETTASIIEALAEAVVRVVSEIIAMAETATRPRRLARIRAELAGIADAVARVGGFVSAAVPAITSRIRMRVEPSTRMNVPPVRR
jgi:hypothetical protein